MNYFKISIITPTLNMGRYLEQCITGVLCQDYPNFEHVVIDGGSKDETVSILKKYQHLQWISEPDKGLSDALNKGISQATGDIIGWCNADDYYFPGTLKIVNKNFQEDPSIMVLYGDYREINADGMPLRIKREIDFDLFLLKYLHVNYIATPAAFWNKKLHGKGFWFNEEYNFAMDYDFLLRIALSGHRISHIPALLCDFRRHPETKSADSRQGIEFEKIKRAELSILSNSHTRLASVLRTVLLGSARTLRTLKRTIKGHYYDQWWRY